MAEVRTFSCNLCEALCGMRVAVDGGASPRLRGDRDDVLSRGHICPKAPALRELLDDPDRLRHPGRAARGRLGARRVGRRPRRTSPRASAPCARATATTPSPLRGQPRRSTATAPSLGAQLSHAALGTKNRFDPNSQDSNPRLFACMQVYGDALSSPSRTSTAPTTSSSSAPTPPRRTAAMMALGDVRARLRGVRERGGRVVLVDPRRTETAAFADAHHFIRPGGDAALLLAMLHVLFAEGRVDPAACAVGARARRAARRSRRASRPSASPPPSA